jgi:hypothetical protein
MTQQAQTEIIDPNALGQQFSQALGSLQRGDGAADDEIQDAQRFRRIAFGMFAVYMIAAVGIYLWRGIFFTPDRWAVLLLVGALLLGRVGSFLRDWIPFVLLIFGYEYLRGIAGTIVVDGKSVYEISRSDLPNVRLENLIHLDERLFLGHSPIILLQDWLYEVGNPRWWDFLALIMYSMHFVLPCVFAFALWLTHKRRFWMFTITFCLMTYSAFAFFLLYPAAPPWLAQSWGVFSGLWFPQNDVIASIQPEGFQTLDTYAIWGNASPHPVAAMPSLHASFPWLVLLFAVRYFGWKGLWLLTYNVALWFAVLYTANHWFIDVLAGMAWASLAFFGVQAVQIWLSSSAIAEDVGARMRQLAGGRVLKPIVSGGRSAHEAGSALRSRVGRQSSTGT